MAKGDFAPKRIIVHHSLTEDSGTVSWGAIRWFHMTDPAYLFKDIGYHAGVELVQSGDHFYYEILMGRMWDTQGAHTKNENHDSLGICFIGNYDLSIPPDAILLSGAKIIRLWMKLFGIPIEKIYPHSAFANKSCPGTQFNMNALKNLLRD